MKLLFGLSLLSFHAGIVYAQNSTAASLLSHELRTLGLDALAAALDIAAQSPVFDAFFNEIGGGNKTFFVPTSLKLDQVPGFVSDLSSLIKTFDYHIARGQLSPITAPVAPSHVVAPSLLTDNSTVFLKGGDAQWIVATKQDDGNLHILNQGQDVVVSESHSIDSLNMTVNFVDNFLVPPGNLSTTFTAKNLTQFQAILQKAGLFDTLSGQRGVTLFAPTDAAFASASNALGSADTTTLTNILQNHVLNTTVYSTMGANQFSVTGQTLHISDGSVSIGGSTAKLSQTDVGLQNGVLHVIDTVLLDKSTGPSSGTNRVVACLWLPLVVAAVSFTCI